MFGAATGRWKGGRGLCESKPRKYVRVHDGPNQRAFEHRKIAERVLGRPLTHMEVVHHIDCDKTQQSAGQSSNLHSWLSQMAAR